MQRGQRVWKMVFFVVGGSGLSWRYETLMKINAMFSAAVGVLAAGLLTASAEEKVTLALKWQPGKAYLYTQDMNMSMTMKQGDQNMDMKQTMKQSYRNTVVKVDKGNEVTMSFDTSAMKMVMNGAPMLDLDSENPETLKGPQAEIIKQMLDIKVTALYDEKGQVVEVRQPEGGGDMVNQFMDADTLKQMMKTANDYLPAKPVGVGESWEATTKMPMKQLGGDIKITMKMKLEKLGEADGKKLAEISYTGAMTMDGGNGLIGVEAKKFTGDIVYDLGLGQMTKVTTDMDMAITAPGAPAAMPISAKTVIALTDVVDAK